MRTLYRVSRTGDGVASVGQGFSHGGASRPSVRCEAASSEALEVRRRLERLVVQESLFVTQSSLEGLAHVPQGGPPPRAVFVGIGLASSDALSAALPIDVLGLLLAAEHARRAAGAEAFLLLLADAHALHNGLSPDAVATRAAAYERVLHRVVTRLGWSHVELIRASQLHARVDYARLHEQVRRRAPAGEHPYFTREVADIAYFARTHGSILKVGWALGPRQEPSRDERAFDSKFLRWTSGNVGFLYSKAGRALDDRGLKAVPYVDCDPERRVCLSPDECVSDKLGRAMQRLSPSTIRGVRRHLRAIARSYGKLVRPISGPVEQQIEQVLDDVFGAAPFAQVQRPRDLVCAS